MIWRGMILAAFCAGTMLGSLKAQAQQASAEEAREIARDAYIYAYPLVLRSAANPQLAPKGESRFRKPPVLLLERSLWRISEAYRHSVVGVHRADRDREIDKFLFLEDRARGLERFIRHTNL